MKLLWVLFAALALVSLGCSSASSSSPTAAPRADSPTVPPASQVCTLRGALPDPTCTPGAIDTKVTQENIQQTICVSGYTASVRPPASYTDALKLQQLKAYGLDLTPAQVEEDHLIPLELGGNPRDPKNLWPEPRSGDGSAGSKDKVENALHKVVCAGNLLLADAQQRIARDWTTATQGIIALATPAIGGQPTPVATFALTEPPTVAVPTAPVAPGALTIISLTSPVAVGGVATLKVTAAPNTICTVAYTTPAGTASTAAGLTQKQANNIGEVSWSWNIGTATRPGTGSVRVTCAGQMAQAAIVIQ